MKITFKPTLPTNELLRPEPAIKHLPDWYKNLGPFMDGEKKQRASVNYRKNVTVKWCNPFGDALGAGYFIFLENEIQITKTSEYPEILWFRGGDEFIGSHEMGQISNDYIPDDYVQNPYKFKNFWRIETPKGYSTIFTHPINRTDLPFLTLTGVVDTDTYKNTVNFPFILKKDFEGNIQSGTPIAQVIPFKRDSWQSEVTEFDAAETSQVEAELQRHITRPYKRLFHQKKEYR